MNNSNDLIIGGANRLYMESNQRFIGAGFGDERFE